MEMSHLSENLESYRILDAVFNPRVHLNRLDGLHLSQIRDWSSIVDQEDRELKNKDDGEKHQSPQLQRITEDNTVEDPPTSSSTEQTRSPGPNTSGKTSESSGTEDSSDENASHEDWPKLVYTSGAETEDSDTFCRMSSAPVSGENSDMTCNTVEVREKPFACDQCGTSFTHHGHLKRHMRIHTGEKPFVCDVCGKSFIQHCDLKIHMRIHTGEKPFPCDVCGKRFTQHGDLKTHMRIHTGEKPFVCDVCGKRFTQHGDLKTHMRIHTGEKPFVCDVCGKRFTQHGNLTRHIDNLHRTENI